MVSRILIVVLMLLLGALANFGIASAMPLISPLGQIDPIDHVSMPPNHWPYIDRPPDVERRYLGFGRTVSRFEGGGQAVLADSILVIEKNGFPMRSMQSVYLRDREKMDARLIYGMTLPDALPRTEPTTLHERTFRFMPLQPIMPGFLVNTLLYAGLIWAAMFSMTAVRRYRRLRRGVCPACAYPFGVSPRCTECGYALRVRSS